MLLSTLLCVVPLSLSAAGGGDAPLRAGVAVVDITPPVGYRMSGYFRERCSTGVHDPLQAKAMVLRQGPASAALVFCDLIGIAPEASRRARDLAETKTGIPAPNILVAAIHSHTGPLYFGSRREHLHQLALAERGKDPCETVDYGVLLAERVAQAVAEADAKARPVSLEGLTVAAPGLSFNRRFHMKGGGPVRFNPGKLNPNIIKPAGPIDPEIGFLLARDAATGEALFSLSSFALHLDTVGGTEYSADYPCYLARELRGEFGEDFVSLFGIGTCGDINHIDVSHDRRQKGHEEAERIGNALGGVIVGALPSLNSLGNNALALRSAIVDVPLRPCTPEEVATAQAAMVDVVNPKVPFLQRVETNRIVGQASRGGSAIPMEVQVFRLSPGLAIVGLPGEIFVELGLAIKAASPFRTTLVIELANDAPAYIPTKKAFTEGSYETVNSYIASGGGEMLVEQAVALLRELATRP